MSFLHKYNNPAGWIGVANVLFALSLSAAYFVQKDFRRSLYFFFAACITATIVF